MLLASQGVPLLALPIAEGRASENAQNRALSAGELSLNEPWTGRRTDLSVPARTPAQEQEVTSMQEIRRYQVYRVRQRPRPWLPARLRRVVRLIAARGPQPDLAAQTKARGPRLAAPDPAAC